MLRKNSIQSELYLHIHQSHRQVTEITNQINLSLRPAIKQVLIWIVMRNIVPCLASLTSVFTIGCGLFGGSDEQLTPTTSPSTKSTTNLTNNSILIPTLETNLTKTPASAVAEKNGGALFDQALELEKSGKLNEALESYIKAANQNVREAQYNLGYMYEEGEAGLKPDISLAVEWYRKAADQNLPEAQHMLGNLYSEGRGVPEDYIAAAKWYKKAADQNFLFSQYQMGVLYAVGKGVEISPETASKWFLKAAKSGLPQAQYTVGQLYITGKGVEQDVVKAYMWMNIAALTGSHKEALKSKRDLLRHMKPDQVTAAQIATTEYLKTLKKD